MSDQPRSIDSLQTPALLLDQGRLEANCARMLERCRRLGVGLRPHMKTMKSIDVARLAIDPSHGGITVSTLHEAEYFAAHGIADILLAVCITPDKFERAAAIACRIERLGLFLDDVAVTQQLADFCERSAAAFDVWIEIDSGEHRTGLVPSDPALIEIARAVERAAGLRLAGVATHAGHSYACRSHDEIVTVACGERDSVLAAARRLQDAGIVCAGRSIGSTPTACFLAEAAGITEIRAGVYQAGDLVQMELGSCSREDIALSVLATVVSHQRGSRKIIINAGGLALSKDGGSGDLGYGVALDAFGEDSLDTPIVSRVYQEHGEIHDVSDALFEALPVGARVRILPNHACMTAAMYDEYQRIGSDGLIAGSWPRTNGWS